MIQGPKAILSSAIATALDEFFVVDKNSIESNLLLDAKIVLTAIELRPLTVTLPSGGSAQITGGAGSVTFSWSWGVIGGSGWVQDAHLVIEEMHVKVALKEAQTQDAIEEEEEEHKPSATETIEQAAQQHASEGEIKKAGGISGYVQNQVRMIMDSVKVQLHNFSLTLELPSQDRTTTTTTSVVVGGELLEIISLGRMAPSKDDRNDPHQNASGNLTQRVVLQGFSSHILVRDEKQPLVDPFSYMATATRTGGNRFDSFMKNMKFVGGSSEMDTTEGTQETPPIATQLALHFGGLQIKTLSHLSVLFLAPPSATAAAGTDAIAKKPSEQEHKEEDNDDNNNKDPPSTFDFGLDELLLELDDMTLKLPKSSFHYCADGTRMALASQGFHVVGKHVTMTVSDLTASLVGPMTLELGTISELLIPDTFQLTQPMHHTKLIKEGQTYSIGLDTIEGTLLQGKGASNEEEEEKSEEGKPQEGADSSAGGTVLAAPFPISLSLHQLRLTKEADGSRMSLSELNVYANPTQAGTEWAIVLGLFENNLLLVEDAQVFGMADGPNQISNLRVSVKETVVTAGHSTEEWQAAIKPKKTAAALAKKQEQKKKKDEPKPESSTKPTWKLPKAYIDPIKLTISFKGTGISVNDTKVTVKAFQGKEDTTPNDLVKYYASSCLARVSDFIPNAEVLGLNVVDSTVSTWGNLVGMATLGPLGGVAALGAIDGVKASIAAGKKSRHAEEGDETSPLDIFRGIAYTINESKDEAGGNPLHAIQAAASNTGNYVSENKARLGGAGIGSAGMIVGGLLGGPIGAIAVGLASQAVGTHTIETLENQQKKKEEESK